jgi:hypothetical protein
VEREEKKTISSLAGLLDTAMEISRKRQDLLQRMKAAFERGDDGEAMTFARQLCGVDQNEQTRN